MRQRRSPWWAYVAAFVGVVVGAALVGLVADSLEGNLSTGLAAGMFLIVTLVSGFALYYRVKKRRM